MMEGRATASEAAKSKTRHDRNKGREGPGNANDYRPKRPLGL